MLLFLCPFFQLAVLDKFCVALGTVDFDASFSPGNSDLLATVRAGINMMCLSLFHQILFPVKTLSQLCRHSKILLIFCIPLLNIPGQYPEICVNDRNKTDGV